ncbi:MAG TPA: AAA family ATPase, partial [Polyangiales bacterium]|nr:AAA family ATPase [Polyangiales bacterium]
TRRGKPVTVLVHGVSGIGKSALVRCFANELIQKDEAVVLRGRCYERESVPYKAFDEVIDALSRYLMRQPADQAAGVMPRNIHALARLFPVLKRVKAVAQARVPMHQTDDPRELRNQAFGALKDLLLRLSDFRPLVINIDDLQWGDADSARLLAHILGDPDAPPILFVGSYRREEATTSPFLRHVLGEPALRDAGAIENIEVDALAPDEAEALTQELLRELPLANTLFTRSIAAESEGVPFFIGELTEYVKAQAHHPSAEFSSVSLDAVIATRVASMPEQAQRLLEVLSVAARPLEQSVALEAAGLPTGDRAAVLALRAARLVRTRGTRQTDGAETYHDRVRETVVAQLPQERVRALHARIARASEAWGLGEPEHLVVHYVESGDGARAGETALQAAQAAAHKLAFNRAADLYRKAIELFLANGAKPDGTLYGKLGDALANAGRGAEAAEAYLRAAGTVVGLEARKLQLDATQQLLRSGRYDRGLELARGLLSSAGLGYPETAAHAVASCLWSNARLAARGLDFSLGKAPANGAALMRVDTLGAMFRELSVVDPLRGTALQLLYLREALDAGEPHRIQLGLAWQAFNTALLGGPAVERRVRAILDRAERLANEVGTPYAHATWQMAKAGCAFFFGRYEEVKEPVRVARETFREQC